MEYDCVEEFQLLRGPRGHTTCREQEAGETGLDIVLTVLGNDRRNLQILRSLQNTFRIQKLPEKLAGNQARRQEAQEASIIIFQGIKEPQ